MSSSAAQHGANRFRRGYTAAMLVEESRMLQVSIFYTLQSNLANIDYSVLLIGVMTIADEIDFQLSQAITSHTQQTLQHCLRRSRLPGAYVQLKTSLLSVPGREQHRCHLPCRHGLVLHYVSPSSFHVLGWKPEEMTGKRPYDFILPQDLLLLSRRLFSGRKNSPRNRSHAQRKTER